MKPYFQDEYVTLYHGDCLKVTEWLDADVLVTDPPYGIAWRGITTGVNKGFEKHKDGISGDLDANIRDDALALWAEKKTPEKF